MQSENLQTNSPPRYSFGIGNDDYDCYGIVIKQDDKPVAMLIAPEDQVAPLVSAGNCHAALVHELRENEKLLSEYVQWHHKRQGGCSVEWEERLDATRAALLKAGVA